MEITFSGVKNLRFFTPEKVEPFEFIEPSMPLKQITSIEV
jgi:hypothetical protein